MKKISILCIFLATALGISVLPQSASAAYPEKAIDFIIPFGAGGGADIEGRVLAKEMSKVLGVPLVVINKPGAGGAVTYTYVKNSKPDGYTVAWNSTSILTSTNIGNVPWGYKALDHIGRVHFQPLVVAVNAKSKWKTVEDFVGDCKKKPNSLKIGHAGTGSTTHLTAVIFTNLTGCKAILVPLGVKRRNPALLSGEVDAMGAPLTGAVRLWKAKKFRIITHITGKRNQTIPDVPTMKELGYNIAFDHFRGLSLPKGVPAAVRAKLVDAMMKASHSKAFKKLSKIKGFTVDPSGPEEFGKMLARRDKIVADIMKSAGIYRSK
jgi:tripartite-type tricarboxylate transporter receptor subunit TctC